MKIDFVSDVSCPWCAVGLRELEDALERVAPEIRPELHFQPFELNPKMGPQGQDIVEHLGEKYGATPAQLERNQQAIRARGEAVGFAFRMDRRSRIFNTFDAHRLLHWAGLEDTALQHRLKRALFSAYFTDGENPGSRDVLLRAAAAAGLDAARAARVIDSGEFADDVRERERYYTDRGIHSVPSVIIDDKHLIQGGQTSDVFEQALRKIAAQQA